MGYACPVCDQPQVDAGHLANHLAFTALTGGDDHEAWLDEQIPGWGQLGETELAEEVVEYATEAEYPQVFEDTTAGHDHDHSRDSDLPAGARDAGTRDSLSERDRKILAEARDLTREMLTDEGTETDGTDEAETE